MVMDLEISHVKLSVLFENSTYRPGIIAAHGLSLMVHVRYEDSSQFVFLFDTGSDPNILENNVKALGKTLRDVNAIVISHGHYDHTGGLLKALELIGRRTPIILHPDALLKKLVLKPKIRYNGIPFRREEIEKAGGIIIKNRKPLEIAPNIYVLGEIPRETDFETISGFYIVRNGNVEKDEMLDDQGVVIKMPNGVIILSGCGHSGIINMINYATKISKQNRIKLAIGGFHLINADRIRINKTLEIINELEIEKIAPMHCSGTEFISKIATTKQEKYLELHTGDEIIIK